MSSSDLNGEARRPLCMTKPAGVLRFRIPSASFDALGFTLSTCSLVWVRRNRWTCNKYRRNWGLIFISLEAYSSCSSDFFFFLNSCGRETSIWRLHVIGRPLNSISLKHSLV